MGTNHPPAGGGINHDKSTLPRWMDASGDRISCQTMLLRAVSIASSCASETSTSHTSPPTEVKLPANPFLIQKSVEEILGADARELVSAIKEARGSRYVLRTFSRNALEKLLQMRNLIDGTPVEVIMHPSLNSSQGMIYDEDTITLDVKEIQANLASQNVVNVRRITKRVGTNTVNTPLIVLTFSEQSPPTHIFLGLLRVSVRSYYPTPLLCYACANYGHTRKNCNQQPICLNCSKQIDTHNGQPCTENPYCQNCKGEHGPTNRKCPVYVKEKAIIKIKVDQNMTFGEARLEYNSRKNKSTYANQTAIGCPRVEGDKDRQIKALQDELKKRDKQNEELKALRDEMEKLKNATPNEQSIIEIHNEYKKELDAVRAELYKYREAYMKNTRELTALKAATKNNPVPKTSGQSTPNAKKAKLLSTRSSDLSSDETSHPAHGDNKPPTKHETFAVPSQRTTRQGTKGQTAIPHQTRSNSNENRRANTNMHTAMDVEDVSISD